MKTYIPIRSLLAVALVCSATSCATAPDQQFFQKGSLSNIRRIVVVSSSEDLTVKNAPVPQEPEHSRGQQANNVAGVAVGVVGVAAIILFPLPVAALSAGATPILWAVAVQREKKASQAKILRSATPKETIAQRFSEHFSQALLEAKAFESIREMPTEAEGGRERDQLVKEDGLVKLKVKQVCLRRVSPYGLSLLVGVSAEMFSLKNGREDALLWSRQENLDTEEAHPLEFYKTNGIPVLDISLARLAKRLADDIVYSK